MPTGFSVSTSCDDAFDEPTPAKRASKLILEKRLVAPEPTLRQTQLFRVRLPRHPSNGTASLRIEEHFATQRITFARVHRALMSKSSCRTLILAGIHDEGRRRVYVVAHVRWRRRSNTRTRRFTLDIQLRAETEVEGFDHEAQNFTLCSLFPELFSPTLYATA